MITRGKTGFVPSCGSRFFFNFWGLLAVGQLILEGVTTETSPTTLLVVPIFMDASHTVAGKPEFAESLADQGTDVVQGTLCRTPWVLNYHTDSGFISGYHRHLSW